MKIYFVIRKKHHNKTTNKIHNTKRRKKQTGDFETALPRLFENNRKHIYCVHHTRLPLTLAYLNQYFLNFQMRKTEIHYYIKKNIYNNTNREKI